MSRADCTVRALVIALGIEYAAAEAIAADGGRKPGCRASTARIIEAAKRAGFRFRKVRGKSRTVARFTREHPVGTFVARIRGHAFAIVAGSFADGRVTPNSILLDAWEVQSDALAKGA